MLDLEWGSVLAGAAVEAVFACHHGWDAVEEGCSAFADPKCHKTPHHARSQHLR